MDSLLSCRSAVGLLGKTSPYIVREIRVAAKLGIPMALFHESRVQIEVKSHSTGFELAFPVGSGEEPIVLAHKNLFGPFRYDDSDRGSLRGQIIGKADAFVDFVLQNQPGLRPYAFLITRLQDDFALARAAIRAAVEHEAGVPCLWSDDNQHSTNIEGIRERTRLVVKHAEFAVADFSFGPESPDIDNPSRALELGMAVAYWRPVLLFAQGPHRVPFFAAGDIHMDFWEDEEELYQRVRAAINSRRADLGRRVYNRDLTKRDKQYQPVIRDANFEMDPSRHYLAPNVFPLSTVESWFVAAGFGLIALSVSLLAEQLLGFSETFDFAAILSGIFTLVFASNLNKLIRQKLGRLSFLRWFIPLVGLILLVTALVVSLGAGSG